MRTKRLLLLPVTLLCALAVSPVAIADELERVPFAQFGKERFLLYLPLYVAMEEGLFQKRGLEIDLKFVGNDDQIFASVMSGDAYFGIGDPFFAAIAREKGGEGKIVAMMITKLGLSGYTNNPKITKINSAAELGGLRLSSLPKPSTTYVQLTQLIKKYDLAKTGTKLVQAPFGSQLATLEANLVDIAIDLEPATSIAEDKGYPVVFEAEKYFDEQAITGISVMEATTKERPDLVQKVVSALQEAMIIVNTDTERANKVSQKLFPTLSPKVIKAAVDRMVRYQVFPKSVKVEDAFWQRSLQTRLDSGDLKKPQPTALTVDNTFAERALQAN
jgi:NitT/TauT family transport system substrate-binding protein